MKNNRLKRVCKLVAITFCLFVFIAQPISIFAVTETPTESYTHLETASGSKKTVSMRSVYVTSEVFDVRSMGLEEGIEKINDIDCDDKGNLYLLSSDGRLCKIDAGGKLINEIVVEDEDQQLDITGASGIFAYDENEIYIADTQNERVLQINRDGKVEKSITRPDSSLIPDDFKFAPVKIEKDSKGVLYVLCDGAYYGALLFGADDKFTGFYGANQVKGSALTTLSYIWDTLTKNDTKRASSVKKLPYQFLDMYIDGKDFVYTCTGKTSSGNSTGQIKKLSPSGTNILYKQQLNGKKTSADSFNFGEVITVKRNNKTVNQNFISIQSDERGFIYALDSTFGIIYVYDTDCNLVTAFGGGSSIGGRKGVFASAIAMSYYGGKIYVADNVLNTVTVFERTDFGETLLSAQEKTLSSKHTEAKDEWEEVLKSDSDNRFALRGLAKAYLREGDYEKAKGYAKRGADYVTYGQAADEIAGDFTAKNFVWIFLLILTALGVVLAFAVITVKRQVVLVKNEKVRVLLRAPIHPFEAFNAVRYKNSGSLIIAGVMTLLYYLSSVIAETLSNFRFTSFDADSSNAVFQLLRTVGLIALFSVANWLVCVLMEGKGSFKSVYIVTAYAVLPLSVYNLVFTVLSHLITSPTSAIFTGLSTLAMIFAGIILTVGMMIIHEFSFLKFIGSVLLTLFAMMLIVFIIFMVGMMISQLWSFIAVIFMEIIYR